MSAYYNEHDPFAAAWLRELIKAGHIAPGDVDERSIEDVSPDELAGYVQCHFFAGIGVWSHALRLAEWDDNRAIWTGSCPCQPFSAAGKGAGFDDERHLWPAFFDLIGQRAPSVVIGEQVASKDGLAWLDLVRADVEGSGRAFAAADLCAAGFGAPHIRQRSFWVAYNGRAHGERRTDAGRSAELGSAERGEGPIHPQPRGSAGGLSNATRHGRGEVRADGGRIGSRDSEEGRGAGSLSERASGGLGFTNDAGFQPGRHGGEAVGHGRASDAASGSGGLADSDIAGLEGRGGMPERADQRSARAKRLARGLAHSNGGHAGTERQQAGREHGFQPSDGSAGIGHNGGPPTNGFWSDADWLGCRDGKWRPVEPGTFPLAHGATNRVGRLRGYGNAIVAPVAQGFIECVMEIAS